MASFPDLRSCDCLAHAECQDLRSFGPFVLRRSHHSVSLNAFSAVSELATLRGAKASETRWTW